MKRWDVSFGVELCRFFLDLQNAEKEARCGAETELSAPVYSRRMGRRMATRGAMPRRPDRISDPSFPPLPPIDIARVQDEAGTAQEFQGFGARQAMGIGDQADDADGTADRGHCGNGTNRPGDFLS